MAAQFSLSFGVEPNFALSASIAPADSTRKSPSDYPEEGEKYLLRKIRQEFSAHSYQTTLRKFRNVRDRFEVGLGHRIVSTKTLAFFLHLTKFNCGLRPTRQQACLLTTALLERSEPHKCRGRWMRTAEPEGKVESASPKLKRKERAGGPRKENRSVMRWVARYQE